MRLHRGQICNKKAIQTVRFIFYLRCIFLLTPLEKNPRAAIEAKEDVVVEFRASKQFTDLLDFNYTVGFEDFCMDAMENFTEVDFRFVKLNLGVASSLLQTTFKDVNIEDDATTQPPQDEPNVGDDPPQ